MIFILNEETENAILKLKEKGKLDDQTITGALGLHAFGCRLWTDISLNCTVKDCHRQLDILSLSSAIRPPILHTLPTTSVEGALSSYHP